MSEPTKNMLELIGLVSANPADACARLNLAKLYYQLNYIPFAVREVRELVVSHPNNERLKRLLEKLEPSSSASLAAKQADSPETIAEADFDMQDLEELLEDS